MKILRMLTLVGLTLGSAAWAVDAACLHDATNDELLNELSFRLRVGPGPTPTVSARAVYTCDTSTNFTVRLLAPNGVERTKSWWLGNQAACDELAKQFNGRFPRVNQLLEIAFCDSSTNLHRVHLSADGTVSEPDPTWIGNAVRCQDQAATINNGN